MTRGATPKLQVYAALSAGGLAAALAVGRPELAIAAAPFALIVVVGLLFAGEPRVRVSTELETERALEGDEVELRLHVYAPVGVSQLELLVELPPELEVFEGVNPRALRLDVDEERELALRLRCAHWGAFRLGPVVLRVRDVGGVVTWQETRELDLTLRAYPKPEALRELVRPRETQAFAGNRVSRHKGDGLEFADLRTFAPGDRIRRINWRASARRGELWVNEHHPERNSDAVVFLDTFAEARRADASTVDQAVRAAVALVERHLAERDRVGLISFGGVLNWLRPATGLTQLYRVVEALLNTEVTLSYAWKDLDVIPRGTLPPHALVLALTPLLDERAIGALLDLRARGFDLAVIEISPLPYVGPADADAGELAWRLWRLRREARRLEYERAGVPVVEWREEVPLAAVLEGVRAYRRHAAAR